MHENGNFCYPSICWGLPCSFNINYCVQVKNFESKLQLIETFWTRLRKKNYSKELLVEELIASNIYMTSNGDTNNKLSEIRIPKQLTHINH